MMSSPLEGAGRENSANYLGKKEVNTTAKKERCKRHPKLAAMRFNKRNQPGKCPQGRFGWLFWGSR